MPCLLKISTNRSPGVITFNTTELFSPLFKKKEILNFLNNNKKWIFGVNLSGSYERISEFPNYKFISFMLCYSKDSPYLQNIEPTKIIDLCYINFCKTYDYEPKNKYWDISVISRDSSIKRVISTVKLIDQLTKKNSKLKILMIVPDERTILQKLNFPVFNFLYKDSYFNLIKKNLDIIQSKQIDFISCDVEIFGNHTLSEKTIHKFISDSKFVMINSKKEGINRTIIEGFLYGAKAIIPIDLESEIVELYLNEKNTVFIDDNFEKSSEKILENISKYEESDVNKIYFREKLSDNNGNNQRLLKERISKIFEKKSLIMDGKWYLNNLNFRLCNHGSFGTHTISNNKNKFFKWFDRIEKLNEDFIDEDNMFNYWFRDKPSLFDKVKIYSNLFMYFIKNKIKKVLKKIHYS
jgi:hypothetical protein